LDFYAAVPESENELLQGDVLFPIPFTRFDLTDCEVLAPDESGWIIKNLGTSTVPNGSLVARFEIGFGLVLNQTCDLAKHSSADLLIARVFPRDDLYTDYATKPVHEFLTKKFTNAGQMPQYFYLPAFDDPIDMPNSLAYLLSLQSFPRGSRDALLHLRQKSLSRGGLNSLQEKIAYCFGRFGADESLFYSPEEWNEEQEFDKNRAAKDFLAF
jgi:hypothetical protein